MTRTRLTAACLALLMTSVCGPALAQQQPNTADVIAPAALPRAVPPIPTPTSAAYPGVITLNVDASDVERGLINVTQTIPVSAGSVTLLYPKFLPGNHAPTGPISMLTGLTVAADGQPLQWLRDPVDPWAFHVEVPQGATQLDVAFTTLTPTGEGQGRRLQTPEMLNLQWEKALLYPAGYNAKGVAVVPSVKLPAGWRYGVALETASFEGDLARFAQTDLYTLVDSPMFAGINFREIALGGGDRAVRATVVADKPNQLEGGANRVEQMESLVVQADRLFGGQRHFDHYTFLVGVTDTLGDIGLEHHRSSENTVATGYFNGEGRVPYGDLAVIPHEYVHSWNGKFRRPADQMFPNYNVPTTNSLLWVYEGQTQYWGDVLTARSGFVSKDEALAVLAGVAASYQNQAGRQWRPLQDTTNTPVMGYRAPNPYSTWARGTDYYRESGLIWLDADTLIRSETNGRKSLDDFAKRFFGVTADSWSPQGYAFEDVVAALNAVHPHDWATFLRTRLDAVNAPPFLDGLERGGYRLTYTDAPSDAEKKINSSWENDFQYSLGFSLAGPSNRITGVRWGGLAFDQGVGAGWELVAVNDMAASPKALRDAVTAAKGGSEPIRLILKNGERFRTVAFPYHDGLRYSRLERIAGSRDHLGDILAPRRR